MGDKFIDSEDLLTLLAENMPTRYTEEMNIFIDGFESFSRGQMAVSVSTLRPSTARFRPRSQART